MRQVTSYTPEGPEVRTVLGGAALTEQCGKESNDLHGFAQTHIVRQDPAAALRIELPAEPHTLALVFVQVAVDAHRHLSLLNLRVAAT